MAEEILVNQIEAGSQFARAFAQKYKPSVAFWIKPANADRWDFYFASDDITGKNPSEVYLDVLKVINETPSQWLDPFQVNAISSTERIAREVIGIRGSTDAGLPIIYRNTSLGGIEIDGAYIYRKDFQTQTAMGQTSQSHH